MNRIASCFVLLLAVIGLTLLACSASPRGPDGRSGGGNGNGSVTDDPAEGEVGGTGRAGNARDAAALDTLEYVA